MFRKIALPAVILFTLAAATRAQEFPKPGPEHEQLKKYEGKWDAVMDMQGQKSKASATYKLICGGMWLESDFEGDLGGMKFQGHAIDGYDMHKKKYVGVWADSLESAPMHSSGNIDEKSKMLVMTGEHVGPDGKPQKFKNTTAWKDDDHFTFKMYMVDAEGKDQLAFSIEYTRRK